MALVSGTRLGPYEIVSPLGAGGMGEVYRARDTRLDRDVAIKVLLTNLSSDTSLKQRLEREAKAVSKLSHPHICALYDVGHQGGVDFLVMEYLEGETLEQRLLKGPLPPEQTLRYAAQVTDGLAKAHKVGITHRDLKPANVMLTKGGAKLMDFGLAKESGPAPLATALTEMTMQQAKLTSEGMIVGTFQYMAPEQLEGKEADTRTDIFALGEMIYEMATGKPAFSGQSRASLIAAILTTEPTPITQLQSIAPVALERVIKKCLAKDPDERWQSASDLTSELQWIASGSSAALPTAAKLKKKRAVPWIWLGALAIIGAATFVVTRSYFTPTAPNFANRVRWNIRAPEKNAFRSTVDAVGRVVISPDGQRIAFVASDESGRTRLWVRALDALDAQPLEGTEGASDPFWSPDSRSLAFFANKQLRRMDAAGGPILNLCPAEVGRGGSWSQDGIIVFASFVNGGIQQVPATGGSPVAVTKIDTASRETTHRWPYFLPDGKHFLYFAASHTDIGHSRDAVYVASLDGKENKFLLHAHANAAFANGYLLYVRESTLMAQHFDLRRLQLTGEAQSVAENVETDSGWWHSVFTVSDNGILAFAASANAKNQLLWFDRSGKQLGSVGEPGDYRTLRLSRDGRQLAVEMTQSGASDLWVFDLKQNTKSQLTFRSFSNTMPAWSPDGRLLAFSSNRQNGVVDIFKQPSGSPQSEEVLLQSPLEKFVLDWSPDGQYLLYAQVDGRTPTGGIQASLMALPLHGEAKPTQLVKWPLFDNAGRFSPDGRWIAFGSRIAGPQQVFVVPFPGPGNPKQLSPASGMNPIWRRDGKAIFYLTADFGSVMETEVEAKGSDFTIGKSRLLFKIAAESGPYQFYPFDVSADKQKFIINSRPEQSGKEITVIANWRAALKK
jgi:serine/threonine protein kinase/Tol biopolymer transport system component